MTHFYQGAVVSHTPHKIIYVCTSRYAKVHKHGEFSQNQSHLFNYLLGYGDVMPAMSCVGQLKKNAKIKMLAIRFITKKYRDNLLVVGFFV